MNPQDPNVPPPASAPPPEDAGSQALNEAMSSSFVVVRVIMVALVILFVSSGVFTVGPQEAAIKLFLGKPDEHGLYGPGLHWAWPAPIDEVVKFKITSLTSADSTVGWYLTAAERSGGAPEPPGMPKLNPANITYALSSDTNIVHVVATAHYRITDPTTFHFKFVDAPSSVTNALNNALLHASSEFYVDGILTSNRAAFRERVQQLATDLVESEHLGVTVDQVDVNSSPPLYLRPKFVEVNQAMQRRDKVLNDAQTYATNTIARANGEADTKVKVADAIRKWRVDTMAAQADTFTNLLVQYEANPELFKRIKQMSVLHNVYTNADTKIMLPPNSREYRFNLNREPQEPGQ